MYVRKVKAGKAIFFQIGKKVNGRFSLIKHIGSAVSPEEIAALRLKALEELDRIKFSEQSSLFPVPNVEAKAKLIDWRITGFHQIFGHVYDSIGFPQNLLRTC